MQRFFFQTELLKKDEFVIEDRETVDQMRRVLRMRPKSKFITLDNSGTEYLCEIIEIGRSVRAVKRSKSISEVEPKISLTLFQALPKKPALFELILQKCTEIGVTKFIPLITQRTERSELPKIERMQRIIQEAAEQSGRAILPTLESPVNFKDVVDKNSIVLTISDEIKLLEIQSSDLELKLFIGPEGGFTNEEVEFTKSVGAKIASLGRRTLRTETAAIVASGLLLYKS